MELGLGLGLGFSNVQLDVAHLAQVRALEDGG